MTISRKVLCAIYAAIGVLALIGTWGNNIRYLDLGFLGANVQFWTDTLVNPASRSITVDIFFFGLAIVVWMVLEARRLGMRGVWLYVVFGLLIAISLTVPLFLIQRERALAARERSDVAGSLSAGDAAGLIALAALSIVYAALTLAR
jgi:uncharacterized protein DUF2834